MDAVEGIAARSVIPEDRDGYISFLKTENMVRELNQKDSIMHVYQVYSERLKKNCAKRTICYYMDEERTKIVISRRDITLHAELERQRNAKLQEALDKANEANRAKSEFLSRMSHDIRTPMNAIIGLVKLAEEQEVSPKVLEYLSGIDASGHFLMGLINDILDLSKIESGKIHLNEEPFTLEDFLCKIRAIITPLMDKKDIDFVINIHIEAQCILIDKLRYSQIFFNLLTNAAKYTSVGGKVTFTVEQLPEKDGRIGLRHTICDDGCGMSQEFLEIAFDPFEQERHTVSSELQGSGLGLAIVKNLVDTMGGTINVSSKIDEGTQFTVELYVKEMNLDDYKRSIGYFDAETLKGIHVLVVEDNELNTIIAQELLEMKGCIVSVAENGAEAVEKFAQSEEGYFDIILMDLRMPVMNGLEATKQIRAMNRKDAMRTPILAMTADAFAEDKMRAIQAGMNGHIPKPVEPELLYEKIASIIQV